MKMRFLMTGLMLALPLFAQDSNVQTQTNNQVQDRTIVTNDQHHLLVVDRQAASGLASTKQRIIGGDGTRGGGETISINGRPELRDLVETSVCDWKNGDEILQTTPYVENILKGLERIDWYFSLALRSEIRSLDYCLTGTLVRVNTEDESNLTAVVTEGATQAAIRLMDTVYIDKTVLGQMSGRSQAYLVVHEAMHSFLRIEEVRRNQKLRSIVKSIEEVLRGRVINRDSFYLQMRRNSIQFPLVAAQLQSSKTAVEFVLADYGTKIEMLAKTSDSAILFDSVQRIPLSLIWEYHTDLFAQTNITNLVEQALFYDDSYGLSVLANSTGLRQVVLGLAYANIDMSYHIEIAAWLESQTGLNDLIELTFGELSKRDVKVLDGVIYIQGQEHFSNGGNAETPAASLISLRASGKQDLSPHVAAYLKVLNRFLEEGDMKSALAMTSDSSSFYEAFGINRLNRVLNELSGVESFEKEVVVRNIKVMAVGFWIYVEKNIFVSANAHKNWKKIKSTINTNELGYKF